MSLTCVVPWLSASITSHPRQVTGVLPVMEIMAVAMVVPLRLLVLALEVVIFPLVPILFIPLLLIAVLILLLHH